MKTLGLVTLALGTLMLMVGCGSDSNVQKLNLPASSTVQQKAGQKAPGGVADTGAMAAPPGVQTGTP